MGKSLSRLGSVLCGINRIVVNDGHYRHKRQLGEGAFRKKGSYILQNILTRGDRDMSLKVPFCRAFLEHFYLTFGNETF